MMKQYVHLGRDYRGIDGRIIRPYESVRFCHLRDADFRGVDLAGVEFIGCRFNGASFIGANLTGAKFIACFIGDDYDPMYLEEATANQATFIDCYLPYCAMLGSTSKPCDWDRSLVKAATKMLSRDNGTRNDGLENLAKLNDPIVAPFLASCLIDEEWDVVLGTIRVLMQLRGKSFPCDRQIRSLMIYSIGHENILVRDEIAEIIDILQPDDEIVLPVLDLLTSPKHSEQLTGLRAADMLYRIDRNYLFFIDVPGLEPLFYSTNPHVREQCMRFISTINATSPTDKWLLTAIEDPLPELRSLALILISNLLQDIEPERMPSAKILMPLLSHEPVAEVRSQAMYTLTQFPDWQSLDLQSLVQDVDREVLEQALSMISAIEDHSLPGNL